MNFDPSATEDDGTCMFATEGCTDWYADNYDSDAMMDDGSCEYTTDECESDELCSEFWTILNTDEDEGIDEDEFLAGNGDSESFYLMDENGDGIVDGDEMASALSLANEDGLMGGDQLAEGGETTFVAVGGGCGSCYPKFGYWECVGAGLACNLGATAALAALALAANGTPGAFLALLAEGGWGAVSLLTLKEVAIALGVTVAALKNIPAFMAWWDSCRKFYCGITDNALADVGGCTDALAMNFDPSATEDDESCMYAQIGCTDELAMNFDPSATEDDGTCMFATEGCTDWYADNYDSDAMMDDGSCEYTTTECMMAIDCGPGMFCDAGVCTSETEYIDDYGDNEEDENMGWEDDSGDDSDEYDNEMSGDWF